MNNVSIENKKIKPSPSVKSNLSMLLSASLKQIFLNKITANNNLKAKNLGFRLQEANFNRTVNKKTKIKI